MSRRLRLLGVVDSNGVVHSQFDDDNKVKHHIDIWPIGHFIHWRWNGDKGVYTFLEPFQDEETRFNVVRHVIYFSTNGNAVIGPSNIYGNVVEKMGILIRILMTTTWFFETEKTKMA